MLRLLLLALSLWGTSAYAQAPDWRTVAPPLPLSAPVTSITAPVAIGGAAWGPWRKICREQWERLDRTPRRDCLIVAAVIAHVKASPPADPDQPVLVAGEKERATRAARLAGGIPVDGTTWDILADTARSLGINAIPAPEPF